MPTITKLLEQMKVDYETMNFESGPGASLFLQVELNDKQIELFSLFIFPLTNALGDTFQRFVIVPYLPQPYSPDIIHVIATANHDMLLMKFTFDADGDLELILDLPGQELDENRVRWALQILGDYAASYLPDFKPYIVKP